MSGSSRKALREVREWSGVVGRPSRRYKSGRKDLPEFRELLGVPPVGPAVVGRPSQRSRSSREALPKVRELSGCPPRGP